MNSVSDALGGPLPLGLPAAADVLPGAETETSPLLGPVASSSPGTVVGVPRRHARGLLLFAFVLLLWLCSLAGAWLAEGLLAWTVGLLYVAYDTFLIAYVAIRARAAIIEGERSPPTADAGASPTLSVLVAARNEATALPATLDALLGQVAASDEILLIDDGSTDATTTLLAQRYGLNFGAGKDITRSRLHPALRVYRKSNSGKADSLNRGLQRIYGDIVVTLDADTVPRMGALDAMRAAFAAEAELAAACGVLVPVCAGTASGRFFEWFQTFEYLRAFLSRIAWMRGDALLLVSGALAGYRRSVLQALGGFDPRCLVEDYELIHRLHRHAGDHGKRWTVRVLAQAEATTDAPASLRVFMRQRRRWFAGFLQTQHRNRDMTGNPRYGNVGRFMLPLKAIDTLQPIYGLSAFALLVGFLIRGDAVLGPVLAVLGIKLAIDFCFHLWAVQLYHRWLGRSPHHRQWLRAALAALAEPFSFQLMRHLGAVLGWFAFLTGRLDWAPQRPPAPLPQLRAEATP